LLDGPADAAQIVERVNEATDGAFTPPQDIIDLAIGLLAGRGVVTVDNGVATLTDLGKNLLAWRGISSETVHAFLSKAPKFVDAITIHKDLREVGGLAWTIVRSGTDEQKAALAEEPDGILEAKDAKGPAPRPARTRTGPDRRAPIRDSARRSGAVSQHPKHIRDVVAR
jgi:hypothetical protein